MVLADARLHIWCLFYENKVFVSNAVTGGRWASPETIGKTDFFLDKFFLIKTKEPSNRKQTLLGAFSLGTSKACFWEQAV